MDDSKQNNESSKRRFDDDLEHRTSIAKRSKVRDKSSNDKSRSIQPSKGKDKDPNQTKIKSGFYVKLKDSQVSIQLNSNEVEDRLHPQGPDFGSFKVRRIQNQDNKEPKTQPDPQQIHSVTAMPASTSTGQIIDPDGEPIE